MVNSKVAPVYIASGRIAILLVASGLVVSF